ncbi:helix-turn-helix domain-containing protein [Pantoea agglomerans]|uniref:Helix-turn-helix transcriptional regulator n=1 Tax=Enterobacter agglomerans TaxID=549 RepID=A0ACC5RSD2_ENTAG|nr:helix-turn-helix transcriptional regulator [Pantoea agglomerans]MBK4727213.1 helix-turn-helix transcriptional regulator [Pantoea agglomerans]
MKRNYAEKLRAIRKAEGLTQSELALIAGLGLSSVKNYEAQTKAAGISIIERILEVERFQKYTLWLMIGKTSEAAGQIAPALSHSGPEKTESPQLTDRAG